MVLAGEEDSLRQIAELSQDSHKSSDGNSFKEGLRFLPLGRPSEQFRIPQPVLIPQLEAHQRHCFNSYAPSLPSPSPASKSASPPRSPTQEQRSGAEGRAANGGGRKREIGPAK